MSLLDEWTDGWIQLAVVFGRHVLESGETVAAGHVLLELLFERLQADAVLLVGAELGDVETGRVRHVDHVGIGQDHKLVLLERQRHRQRHTNVFPLKIKYM